MMVGGAGWVATVVVRVVVFSSVVRFRMLLVGDEQVKQVCMVHGVCLVQV